MINSNLDDVDRLIERRRILSLRAKALSSTKPSPLSRIRPLQGHTANTSIPSISIFKRFWWVI